jgi:hypothetical protein
MLVLHDFVMHSLNVTCQIPRTISHTEGNSYPNLVMHTFNEPRKIPIITLHIYIENIYCSLSCKLVMHSPNMICKFPITMCDIETLWAVIVY